mmetsp:Transcript_46005/g.67885  ORF Transcript_46005/g.67885 Transcript_46005/m.67885 type:complete len:112 (+) Transcript_46005:610-945(+)
MLLYACLIFINNFFMSFISYVSFFIEFSGLLHNVYLVQIVLLDSPSNQTSPYVMLHKIYSSGFCDTLQALFDGDTAMWNGVSPPVVSVIDFSFFWLSLDSLRVCRLPRLPR